MNDAQPKPLDQFIMLLSTNARYTGWHRSSDTFKIGIQYIRKQEKRIQPFLKYIQVWCLFQ